MTKTKEYGIWYSMKSRCYRTSVERYPRYGGRGISVCDRWRESFEAFYADMGPRPEGHSIERIDNDGPYSPDNCIWVPRKEQGRNLERSVFLEYQGRRQSVPAWADELGLARGTVYQRYKRNFPIELVLSPQPIPRNWKRISSPASSM